MAASGKLLLIAAMALPAGYLALAWFSTPPPAAELARPQQVDRLPRVLERSFGSEEDDLRKVVFNLSEEGSPLTCEIFDGAGKRLLKCRFGYHSKSGPIHGKVAEVQIFEAGANFAEGDARPLRRIVYPYDANGVGAVPTTIDVQQPGVIDTLLGAALVGFNPLTELESASKQGLTR